MAGRPYEANDIADNDEDEKKIRQAESRALKSIKVKNKSRPQPYVRLPLAGVETAHLILLMVTFTLVHHHRPFVQASHVVIRAHGIYATSANNMDIGERTAPFILSAKETSIRPFQPQNSETAVNVHDKYMYNYYTDLSDSYDSIIYDSFESFLAQVHFFEK